MPNNQARSALQLLPRALVFEAVCRHRSFGDAARELELARSTVSQRISELESELGVRLLHRTTRSMNLTEAGRRLLEEIEPIVPRWSRAQAEAQAYSEDPRGLLVVTAPDLIMSRFIAPVVASYMTQFSKMQIELRESTTTLSLIESGVDVALRAGPLPASEHGATLAWEGNHIAVASPALAGEWSDAHPRDLRRATWLTLRGRRTLDHWRSDAGESASHSPSHRLSTDSVVTYFELLRAGAGVGLLPELLARPGLDDGSLVRVLKRWLANPVSFHIVTPSPRKNSAAVTHFVNALKDAFRA